MKVCTCGGSPKNTGRSLCDLFPDVPYLLIMVPRKDNAGARNYINTATTLDEAYFTARINDTDPSQRWYPLVPMKNVEDVRSENILEEFEDGSKYFIRNGSRTFNAILLGVGPTYLEALDEFRCRDYDVLIIDLAGSIVGRILGGATDKFYGLPVAKGSWAAMWNGKKDKTTSKIMLSFEFEQGLEDSDLRVIPMADDAANGYIETDLREAEGLLDIFIIGTPTCGQTSTTVDLGYKFGFFLNPLPVEGLVVADFVSSSDGATSRIRNVTDSANVTITGVTENTPGNYTLTYASQTVADVLRLAVSKNGLDASELSDGDHDLTVA